MTSLKYRLFVQEPMMEKSVTELPGIGTTLGTRLMQSGYPLAKDIYNKLKQLDFDERKFQAWMKTVCDASANHSSDCYEALKKWHDQFEKDKANTSYGMCAPKKNQGGRKYKNYTLDEESD